MNTSPTNDIAPTPQREQNIADAILTRIDNLNLDKVVKDTQKIETPKFIDAKTPQKKVKIIQLDESKKEQLKQAQTDIKETFRKMSE